MKALLIDGQIFQTDAWYRGMGKYMLQVMKKISEINPDYELAVLFNDNIQTDKIRFDTLKYLCPNFKHIHTNLPTIQKGKKREQKRYIAELDAAIKSNYSEIYDISFMITTLFLFDIYSEFPTNVSERTMIFYDLIPLFNWKDLGGYFPPDLYMERFNQIDQTDTIFCISETTRKDLVTTFSIDPEKAVNINGGFTDHHNDAIRPDSFTVPSKYILFPTGDLPHKNNTLVFNAFRELLKQNKDVHLLVTSRFNEVTKDALLTICSKNVLFTGNVSDEELQYLYQNASAVLFSSKYEGLGLPVLDAVFHNKPVIASNIDVFTEMSPGAYYYFEVNDTKSATQAMLSALDLEDFEGKQALYKSILSKYDWSKVAGEITNHLFRVDGKKQPLTPILKKIAIVSANPGININRYGISEKLFFPLRQHGIKTDYYFDGQAKNHKQMERPTYLDHVGARVLDIKKLTIDEYKHYDAIFYIIDNEALKYKVGLVTAVLPGINLVDSEINAEDIMYKIAAKFTLGTMKISMESSDDQTYTKVLKYIVHSITGDNLVNDVTRMLKSNRPLIIKRRFIKKRLG